MKDWLKLALLAGGAAATGGLLAPAAAGAASAGAAGAAGAGGLMGAGAMGPAMGADVAMGSLIPGLESYATGFTGQGLLGAAGGAAKAAAPYALLAQQTGLLNQQPQQPMTAPVAMPQVQGGSLPELSSQMQQGLLTQQQADADRRKQRHSLLGSY